MLMEEGTGMEVRLLELGLTGLSGVLPADQADEVVHAGVGDGDHRHGVELLLGHLHGKVHVDLLGGRRTDVALETDKVTHTRAHTHTHTHTHKA